MIADRIIRRRPPGDESHLPESLHPVLRRVYAARGVHDAAALDTALASLPNPSDLGGCDAAAARLVEAIVVGEQIVVVGDYDADGATSCAVAIRALRGFGARDPRYLVPNRMRDGYGLTPELVDAAMPLRPSLLVTVDNGIASIAGVATARARGIDVIVTDHHLPGPSLPDATVIVNPHCDSPDFAAPNLAGVGVIFYVMLALRRQLRERGWFTEKRREPNLSALLDLVALGTIADVVPLDRVNRVLVAQGLQRIRAGAGCDGVRALAAQADRDPRHLVASDLGFALGPRLNAAGRLADMGLGIECLLSDDPGEAAEIAAQLDRLNQERRKIERDMQEQAIEHLDALSARLGGEPPAGLCLHDPAWHPGVVGILASRIKDRLNRPVIAFATDEEGRLKGSARSIKGLHIRDLLQAMADREPALLSRFGGHAMAAGMTIEAADLEAFRAMFAAEVASRLDPAQLAGTLDSDGELAAEELDIETARALEQGGPWGQAFPEPLFDGRFRVVEQRVVGELHLKLTLQPCDASITMEAIAFGAAPTVKLTRDATVDAAYRVAINRWRNTETLQLIIEQLTPA